MCTHEHVGSCRWQCASRGGGAVGMRVGGGRRGAEVLERPGGERPHNPDREHAAGVLVQSYGHGLAGGWADPGEEREVEGPQHRSCSSGALAIFPQSFPQPPKTRPSSPPSKRAEATLLGFDCPLVVPNNPNLRLRTHKYHSPSEGRYRGVDLHRTTHPGPPPPPAAAQATGAGAHVRQAVAPCSRPGRDGVWPVARIARSRQPQGKPREEVPCCAAVVEA